MEETQDLDYHENMQEVFESFAKLGKLDAKACRRALLNMGRNFSQAEVDIMMNGQPQITYGSFSQLIEQSSSAVKSPVGSYILINHIFNRHPIQV